MALGPCVWAVMCFALGLPINIALPWQVLLSGVLLYPLLEELAFRGFVQTWLLERQQFKGMLFAKLSIANVVTSVLFAALHLIHQPPLWAASVFFPSLVFGYLRERYDSVIASVVVHAWYNFGFLLLFR